MKKILLVLILIIALVAVGTWYNRTRNLHTGYVPPKGEGTEVSYSCKDGKTIDATFYEGKSIPGDENTPPVPGGSAHVVLSDGRVLDLQQTISADGVRYSNGDPSVEGDESFVFWSKGNGALVLENNEEKSYIGCVQVKTGDDLPSQVYSDPAGLFSIRYPDGYIVDATYQYQLENGVIPGVKFTIPQSRAEGTNLGSDSYVSVEVLDGAPTCTADRFLSGKPKVSTQEDNGTTYSVASTTDAAAGNRYEDTVYAIPGTNPCVAVRYLIHYGVFENYEPGTVQEFDKTGLTQQFDRIRRSLVVGE